MTKPKNEGLPHGCGAKTRSGEPCKKAPMLNGRCHMHGGKSSGPRTPEGIKRIREANTRHGAYSQEALNMRRMVREMQEGNLPALEALKTLAREHPGMLGNLDPKQILHARTLADIAIPDEPDEESEQECKPGFTGPALTPAECRLVSMSPAEVKLLSLSDDELAKLEIDPDDLS